MRFGIYVAFLLSTLATASTAEAQANVTVLGAEQLQSFCAADPTEIAKAYQAGICIGYVRSIFDQMYVEAAQAHYADKNFPDPIKCFPSYLTNEIIISIVQNKLRDGKPKEFFAFDFVKKALNQSFPECFRSSGG